MENPNRFPRPGWLRNPIGRFFASLKLAVVLLAVLIVAAITGTIYESSFDAKVARAYVYGAPWFNLWLTLLAANLAVSAFSRWPWRKHHVAFLVTHLGIITLLTGSLIGRIWGIEGTVTLFKGEPPTNRLLVDQHQLRVRDIDGIVKGFPAEFLHHPPTPDRPRDLGALASGARLRVVDYAPAIEGKLNPKPLSEGGAPALHFTINTAMMNQRLESWLLADDPQHGTFAMGLANIELKRGIAPEGKSDSPNRPPSTANQDVDLEESIFAFSKAPDEQIGRPGKGGGTGAKVRLDRPQNGNKGRVTISLGNSESSFDVAENLGREVKIENMPFTLKIDNYWADFRIENGKPGSLSEQPNNPAVLVTIRGKGIPMANAAPMNSHGSGKEFNTSAGPPSMPPVGDDAPNRLTLFIADDGAITYELVSRKSGKSSGKIDINTSLVTGWADWQLNIDKIMPHADQWMDFAPLTTTSTSDLPDGVRVRLEQHGEHLEQWVPAGWQISVPTSPTETQIAYGWKLIPLPIGLELLDFEVKRNEGSDSPAGFKSTLRISTVEGDSAQGQCWMNNPLSYPGNWWHTWTGHTYKISQASWNPENLNQSTVQILRDPGWLFKWIGSLLVIIGVFMMFYLRPYRKQTVGEPITATAPKPQERIVRAPVPETVAR
ncbi:MAG: cytochrome c biogenesis protein ResB [Verrucomicrobiota bacterium]|nr:cytochrome c biogenesis protein ResB [Verrucomicrobiota bacterium]